jgi:hypothetical protein
MTKYYFKPIAEVAKEVYFGHTQKELDIPEDFEKNTVLIVEADSEEDATKIRIGITDVRMWEKIKEE